ncbi:MAG: mechanosensitive ion channel family protein [Euryarchaeota archaeon]|nr:mechanosensitive ion channel family protein [Euryarchaeota archaeon]
MLEGIISKLEEKFMESIIQLIPKLSIILATIIAGIIAAKLAKKIVLKYGQRAAKKVGIELDEKVVEYSAKSIRYIIYASVLIVISMQLGLEAKPVIIAVLILLLIKPAVEIAKMVYQKLGIKLLKEVTREAGIALEDRIYEQSFTMVKILIYGIAIILAGKQLGLDMVPLVSAGLIVFFARPLSEIVVVFLRKIEEEIVKGRGVEVKAFFPILYKVAQYSIYVFAVILAVGRLGFDVMPFVAGLGVVGLALGLAAKDTISNVIAGVFIVIDKPFVIGDRIELWSAPKGGATWGDVIDIGLRSTKIKTTDNVILIIPNSAIYARDVINYTTGTPEIRISIPVGISYESDLNKAEEILNKVAKNTKGVKDSNVAVKDFGQSSIDLELRALIEDARNKGKISSEIRKAIKREFDREGIEIPYPRRVVIEKK